MDRLRWTCVALGCLIAASAVAQTQLDSDLLTLKNSKMPTETAALIDFFASRSLKDGDAKDLETYVKHLDHGVYLERQMATKALITRGPAAMPFLRNALANNPTLELKRRAQECIATIEATMHSDPIAAGARVLAERKDPKAASTLFNFLPSIDNDPFLEEEVLSCVGRLTIHSGRVDPLLLNALKDPLPFRRSAAGFLIGQRASTDYRQQIRMLLDDTDARVARSVADGLFGKRAAQSLADSLAADEKLLRDKKINVSEDGLVAFFRNRTLSDDDQRAMRGLVRDLGVGTWSLRERATTKLLKDGIKALAFLKEAEYDANVERSRRARMCLEQLRQTNNPGIPIAAAHLLARPTAKKQANAAKLVQTLLAYIPFADDEAVEEEVLTCLTLLSLREPKIEPALVAALEDTSPARRAAAAFVLGHVATKEQVALVQPLLDDRQPIVRLRASQGLLAARDPAALPSFVSLLKNIPEAYLPKVEEVLYHVAADKGPSDPIVAASDDSRNKAVKAWGKWLDDNKSKIDLTHLGDRDSYLGLVTVCEYDSRVGNIQGRVWEATRGGPKRWTFGGPQNNTQLLGAMDAHSLPNGRILVAENSANRITERDTRGDIKWEYRTPANPICCQRLPNGNTFIASYNMVMEIRPDKTEVYRINPGPQFYIFSAHKARNGHIVAITAQGRILELEAPSGKEVNSVNTQTLGNWCSVEMLPNGNYLVASMNPGNVREIDRKGTDVWNKPFPGAFRATRLPNGNVLVASMNTREVAEMDRSGAVRWRVTTEGRPWSVHYR